MELNLVVSAIERQIDIEKARIDKRTMQLANPEAYIGEDLLTPIPGYYDQLKDGLQVLQAAQYVISEMQPKPGWNFPAESCTKVFDSFTLKDGRSAHLEVSLCISEEID